MIQGAWIIQFWVNILIYTLSALRNRTHTIQSQRGERGYSISILWLLTPWIWKIASFLLFDRSKNKENVKEGIDVKCFNKYLRLQMSTANSQRRIGS